MSSQKGEGTTITFSVVMGGCEDAEDMEEVIEDPNVLVVTNCEQTEYVISNAFCT